MRPALYITKEVITDPGVGFGVRNVLLFAAGTNTLGLGACIVAAGVTAATKTLALAKPRLAQKFPKLLNALSDSRTPLHAISAALLFVGGAALLKGAFLPAATSILFALGNFRIAASISDRLLKKSDVVTDKKQPFVKRLLNLLIKRPDLYINAGSVCAGVMAGGAALWVIPVVAVALGIALYNVWNQKPEYTGYPKAINAGATVIFSGIGIANGNFLIAASHALGAAVLFNVECRITPGGFRQIMHDAKNSLARLFFCRQLHQTPD